MHPRAGDGGDLTRTFILSVKPTAVVQAPDRSLPGFSAPGCSEHPQDAEPAALRDARAGFAIPFWKSHWVLARALSFPM